MKEVLKKVYYCDFCKKRGLQGWRIQKHELHYTRNKDRECRMCVLVGNSKNDIPKLIEKYFHKIEVITGIYEGSGHETDGKQLMDDTQQCPMCSLTVLRLSNCGVFPNSVKDFDYKKEVESFFSDFNSDELRNESYY